MTSGIWVSTTAQIIGLCIGLVVIGTVLVTVGKVVERTTNGITAELKHLNASMDGVREDLQSLVTMVHSHAERLARIEEWKNQRML